VRALAERKLDWLHVSTRDYHAVSLRDADAGWLPTRRIVDAAAKQVDIIGVGMVHTPDDAAAILADGCVATALGRILLMEPGWVQLAAEQRPNAIRRFLPDTGGDTLLTIPTALYRMLLSREGWLPKLTMAD